MTIKLLKGDLLTIAESGEFDIIVQGCNCMNTMGSGIARQIREKYPQAFMVDQETVCGDIMKLGNWSSAICGNTHKFTIINAYTQYGFNSGGFVKDVFEYASFELILRKLAHNYGDHKFGFPMIGMGLAGGDKQKIIGLLEWFSDEVVQKGGSVTLVEYDQM